jgi:hypothetical protein
MASDGGLSVINLPVFSVNQSQPGQPNFQPV